MVGINGLSHFQIETGHQRLDQLLQNMRYEDIDERTRRMAESQDPDVYLETMEDTTATGMGTAEAWDESILGAPECEQPERNHGYCLQRYNEPHCHK